MKKKIDILYLVAGSLGIAVGAQLLVEHIDRTEDSKNWRIYKKLGVYCGEFALCGLLVDALMAGNLARDFNSGNILLKVAETGKEIVA